MNYIKFLQDHREEQAQKMREIEVLLIELMAYLQTSKFAAPDADYIQISTDLFPKLREIRMAMIR